MPFDYRGIGAASKKALNLVEDPERRRMLEEFVDSTAPLVEAAAREALQELIEEINAQLAPHARLRLVQDGSNLAAEVVPLGDEQPGAWSLRLESDSVSKVLLRMPSNIKERAAESAQRAGVSLNSWTVNILERAVENLKRNQTETETPDEDTETDENQDPGQETAAGQESSTAEDQDRP